MSSKNRDFTPKAAISLHTAVMKAGEAMIPDWDSEAVEILREVFASSPHRLASLPIIVKRWPNKADTPRALLNLVEAVAGAAENGEILSSDEYIQRVDKATAHWPNSWNPAKPQLDAVHALMQQWIGDETIMPFWYAKDGSEVQIDARIARSKNQTAFEALMLYGIAPLDGGGPVWVREAELDSVLFAHRKLCQVEALEQAGTLDKRQIEARYIERVNQLKAKGQRSSEHEDWAFLRSLSPGMPRERAREIRKKHAPPYWSEPGRRGYN